MITQLLTLSAHTPDPVLLQRAADALRAGKLVAFPTETVYGLGANALDDKAVAGVFAAKGRPSFNPLIIHAASAQALAAWVLLPPPAPELMAAFLPGPLTLVLPRRADCPISWLAGAGLPSLAVRVPSHPIAQALLRQAGVPVAAPSANRSGSVSPTTALHVMESLGGKVDMVLAAGSCTIGLESTILDLTTPVPRLLRHGGVTREQLEAVIGPVALAESGGAPITAPGQLTSHYAPNASLRLNASHAEAGEALLAFGNCFGITPVKHSFNLSETGDLREAAANLFAMLRGLDATGTKRIAVMPIPATGLGAAINDRLSRAAAPRIP